MALVVHQPFVDENGVSRVRGDVMFGADADLVARHPHFSRLCSAAPDSAFSVGPHVVAPVVEAKAPVAVASDLVGDKK